MLSRICVLVILAGIASAAGVGCRQLASPPLQIDVQRGLPSLPESGAGKPDHPAAPAPGKAAAVQDQLLIQGSDTFDRSSGTALNGSTLQIAAAAETLEWAIYRIPGITAEYYPTQLLCDGESVTNLYYVALANYASGRWELRSGVFNDDATIPVTDYTAYRSAGGSMYLAVLAFDSDLQYVKTTVTMEDTRPLPPPLNVLATGGQLSIDLTWDPYSDARASELRVYLGLAADLSDGALVDTLTPAETACTVSGVTPGVDNYLALTAYDAVGAMESVYSEIVSAVPTEGGTGNFVLGGIWGRQGGRSDSGGFTALDGPLNFDNYVRITLTAPPAAGLNRTTPVIDSAGNVYALARDAVLRSYVRGLNPVTPRFTYDAKLVLPAAGNYASASTSPLIDADDNVYFVALPLATDHFGYLISLTKDGTPLFEPQLLGICADTGDRPYPAPNFSDGNLLLVAGWNNYQLLSFQEDITPGWAHDFSPSIQLFADPALNGLDEIQVPVWFSGIGIDPRMHWMSMDGVDGVELASRKDFGGPENLYGGLPIPGDMHVYPELDQLLLVDPFDGSTINSVSFTQNLTSSPARNTAGSHVFQALSSEGGPTGSAHLWIVKINPSDPPTLTKLGQQQLGNTEMYSKPAVDGGGFIYLAAADGMLYRVAYDPLQSIGPTNPKITSQRQTPGGQTYRWNSFAVDEGMAYIVSEQGDLYCFFNLI